MSGWHSTQDFGWKRRLIWQAVRLVLPRRVRWFMEGHPRIPGQLWYRERRLLYRTIREFCPRHCFEIGTWRGGGSTLFIAQALYENGGGVLHTVEIDPTWHAEAVDNYRRLLPHLAPHVAFHLGDYREVLEPVLATVPRIDFLMLDGAEDAEQTRRQFEFFRPWLGAGSLVMVHDWRSEKTRLVREPFQVDPFWELLSELAPPRSLGFVLWRKKP